MASKKPAAPIVDDEQAVLELATGESVATDEADDRVAGDDREDGETSIEEMLEDASNDLPAEKPLAIEADMDQKLTSLDDTRPRRR